MDTDAMDHSSTTSQKTKNQEIPCFLNIKNIFSPATLHIIHQMGSGVSHLFRSGLGPCNQEEGASSLLWPLSLPQQSYFLPFPGCLFHLRTRKRIFYPFLVCFSERSLLGANMIISVRDIKMLLSLVKFLVINFFFNSGDRLY